MAVQEKIVNGQPGWHVTFKRPVQGNPSLDVTESQYEGWLRIMARPTPAARWGVTPPLETGGVIFRAQKQIEAYLSGESEESVASPVFAPQMRGGFTGSGVQQRLTPPAPAGDEVRYIYHFDIETAAAGEASVDFKLSFPVTILNVEAYAVGSITSTLTKVTQLEIPIVNGSGSGVPVAAVSSSSLIQGRLVGRHVDSMTPMTFTAKHSAAGKTTIVLSLDQGPGSCG